ncbi:hypothetical protein HK101_002772, partial [Irineochytrium annulatum]
MPSRGSRKRSFNLHHKPSPRLSDDRSDAPSKLGLLSMGDEVVAGADEGRAPVGSTQTRVVLPTETEATGVDALDRRSILSGDSAMVADSMAALRRWV